MRSIDRAEEALQPLLTDSNPRIRARALWILGQFEGREDKYIGTAIHDNDPNVRIVGVRIADLLRRHELRWIDRLINDRSPQIRAECAITLQHHKSKQAAHLWANLAVQHDGKDRWYLEALGIGAKGKWDACLDAYETLSQEPSKASYNDLIWRSRSRKTTELLASIICSPGQGADFCRYVRAFDFQANGLEKNEALKSVVFRMILESC